MKIKTGKQTFKSTLIRKLSLSSPKSSIFTPGKVRKVKLWFKIIEGNVNMLTKVLISFV